MSQTERVTKETLLAVRKVLTESKSTPRDLFHPDFGWIVSKGKINGPAAKEYLAYIERQHGAGSERS